jgi:hypothetical protein
VSDVRTYEIETASGKLRIDIPEDWKVTYGPISIGAKSYDGGHLALRVYESDTKQRAIFTNVKSFRDLSIPVKREVVKRSGSDTWVVNDDSSRSSQESITERSWQELND